MVAVGETGALDLADWPAIDRNRHVTTFRGLPDLPDDVDHRHLEQLPPFSGRLIELPGYSLNHSGSRRGAADHLLLEVHALGLVLVAHRALSFADSPALIKHLAARTPAIARVGSGASLWDGCR